ncbi:hypothetical protein GGI25_001919 [Coemansia spiralis]|uniref:Uncharacterized protein n=1 Tax=Coemansia spiralis TaxID=417178 RepID=A0A9W8G9Z1_9FUNG|nr:hypothetical protein GGI25_001919 [Coemansia spiralis]
MSYLTPLSDNLIGTLNEDAFVTVYCLFDRISNDSSLNSTLLDTILNSMGVHKEDFVKFAVFMGS